MTVHSHEEERRLLVLAGARAECLRDFESLTKDLENYSETRLPEGSRICRDKATTEEPGVYAFRFLGLRWYLRLSVRWPAEDSPDQSIARIEWGTYKGQDMAPPALRLGFGMVQSVSGGRPVRALWDTRDADRRPLYFLQNGRQEILGAFLYRVFMQADMPEKPKDGGSDA